MVPAAKRSQLALVLFGAGARDLLLPTPYFLLPTSYRPTREPTGTRRAGARGRCGKGARLARLGLALALALG